MTEKHRYSLELWKQLIQDQHASGMRICDWCRANGYTKHAYYYWLNQLRKETLPAALTQLQCMPQTSKFADVTPQISESREVKMPSSQELPAAVIRKSGIEIGLFGSASAELIKMLLEGIRNA